MASPLYENEINRENERRVARVLAERWKSIGLQCIQMPRKSPIDYRMDRDGKPFYWLEVKVRPEITWWRIERMGGYMLARSKLQAIIEAIKRDRISAILAVEAKGDLRIRFWQLSEMPLTYDVARTGRTDRGDRSDVEPCVFIPVPEFDKLKNLDKDPT